MRDEAEVRVVGHLVSPAPPKRRARPSAEVGPQASGRPGSAGAEVAPAGKRPRSVASREKQARPSPPLGFYLAACLGSLVIHGLTALGALGLWRLRQTPAEAPPETKPAPTAQVEVSGVMFSAKSGPLSINLPSMSLAADPKADTAEAPKPVGGDPIAHLDTGKKGRGGDDKSRQPALNLADHREKLTLTTAIPNRVDRSQIQRAKTSKRRQSQEDRRATTNPMELSFLATGKGKLKQRRPQGKGLPRAGMKLWLKGGRKAGRTSMRLRFGVGLPTPASPTPPGSGRPSPARGAIAGRRKSRQETAKAATIRARPMVKRGRPSVPAKWWGRARDTVDSRQEVNGAVQALLHASTSGGRRGQGSGGSLSKTPTPGYGAPTGHGSQGNAHGQGGGPVTEPNLADPRSIRYFRQVVARIDWDNAFPEEAAVKGLQGTARYALTLDARGKLLSAELVRPSGVAAFDENLRRAIRLATPFPPIPAILGRGPLRIVIAFDAQNPAVRSHHEG